MQSFKIILCQFCLTNNIVEYMSQTGSQVVVWKLFMQRENTRIVLQETTCRVVSAAVRLIP